AQSNFAKEDFSAVAIVNNNIASGMDRVQIHVTRWSTVDERDRLAKTLLTRGPDQLLKDLIQIQPVGTIRTPDTLAYDLHYAYQRPAEDGGRQIVLATDRPMSFWEVRNQPRSVDYPFTIIQMTLNRDGEGKGTLSYATKVRVVNDNSIELENIGTSPVMLTEIRSERTRN
ncbi:MAG: hypothetical protein U0Q11_28085, partial [Vicinamibacterales bacterium]